MTKQFILLLVFGALALLAACGGGPSAEDKANEAARADSVKAAAAVEQEALEKALQDSIEYAETVAQFLKDVEAAGAATAAPFKLPLGFGPSDAGKYNVSGLVLETKDPDSAKFALIIYSTAGEYKAHEYLSWKRGVKISLNANQTEFTFEGVDSYIAANRVALPVGRGADAKISDVNGMFYGAGNDNCTIVGADDARDNITKHCPSNTLGDLNNGNEILVHFVPVNNRRGNLILSHANASATKSIGKRCSKTCLNVPYWGWKFQYATSPCSLPGQCANNDCP